MASLTFLDPSNNKPENSLIAAILGRKLTTIDLVGGIHCHICQTTFGNKKDFDVHYIQHNTDGPGIVYTCVICQKSISGYPSFRGHCYTNHVMKEKFKCDHCDKHFSKLASLKDHIDVKHKFKCTLCSKEFQTKKELQIHQIIHNNSDNPPYKCQSCEKQINSLEGCEYHIDLHSSFTYSCPICSEASASKQLAFEHLRSHFGDDVKHETCTEIEETPDADFIKQLGGINCCICSTVHRNRVNFDAHFSLKHGCQDIVYTCNKCKKQFDKYSVFGNHCYNHFCKDRFECDQCGKAFPRLSLLATHTEAYHGSSLAGTKPFTCKRCNHRVAKLTGLRQHLRDQHNITCFQCPKEGCERLFETPKELTLHQRYHDDTQNWCRQCGLLFTSLSSCEKHLDVHRKKSYSCPVCGRTYGEKYLANKHVPKHFESVVHICKVCGKIYNAKNRLVEHIKVHSDVKTHTCTHCGKGFIKLNQLKQHLNTHTGVRPYKCVACPKTFAAYPNLNKHLRRMHNTNGKDIKRKMLPESAQEGISENSTDASSSKESTVNFNTEFIKKEENFPINIPENKMESYKYYEPDDSTMESVSIDPSLIEKELQIFESSTNMATNVLPLNSTMFDSETVQEPQAMVSVGCSAGYPLEYGPEFNIGLESAGGSGFIDLDEHILPHIDPLLTIKSDFQYEGFNATGLSTEFDEKWEPIITKVYQDYACGPVMNTNIF